MHGRLTTQEAIPRQRSLEHSKGATLEKMLGHVSTQKEVLHLATVIGRKNFVLSRPLRKVRFALLADMALMCKPVHQSKGTSVMLQITVASLQQPSADRNPDAPLSSSSSRAVPGEMGLAGGLALTCVVKVKHIGEEMDYVAL